MSLPSGEAQMSPSEIYVMNLKGLDEKQITSFGCTILHPAWTPDNRRIVFSSDMPSCQGYKYELFMVNLDGSLGAVDDGRASLSGKRAFRPTAGTLRILATAMFSPPIGLHRPRRRKRCRHFRNHRERLQESKLVSFLRFSDRSAAHPLQAI